MRAVVVLARYPWPPRRGDQMRALDFVAGFRRAGYDVEVLAASTRGRVGDDPEEPGSVAPVRALPGATPDRVRGVAAWLGGAPLQQLPFRSAALESEVLRVAATLGPRDVVLVQLARQAPLVEALAAARRSRGPRIIVDLIDTLSLNFEQRARLDRPWLAPLWRSEARRLRTVEARMLEVADAVCVVCERDRRVLREQADRSGIDGVSGVVPLRVPAPQESAQRRSPSAAPTLMFTGNLGYFVNGTAVRWLVELVWPLLRLSLPTARLVVAGARPPASMARLVARAGGTLLRDPPDLRAVLRTGSVAVAPLRGGAGVPVKVLEAWAEAVPVVASDWAARGVVGPGESLRDVEDALVRVPDGAAPQEWAETLRRVLSDPRAGDRLVKAGADRLRLHHDDAALDRALGSLLDPTGG